jgi:serine/threonine protein kinase
MESSGRTFYLGRYNCVEQLGSGPLGETFRAKIYGVAGFEKQFAVKRLHARLTADEGFVARFMGAASAFSALEHQRIARVHEVNAQGAHYYVVSDLVRGLDLRRLLDLLRQRGEALSADVATLIAVEIAEGLEYAHSRPNGAQTGVLHLGLTAPSVIVTYEGETKLVDVGMMSALIRPGWSQDDELAPTLAYLAPETWRGDAVDGRADLFSLGAIFYELLSGTRLFLSDRLEELRQAVEQGPPQAPPTDARLQQIVTCVLNPDRDMRFRGAAEMRAAMQAVLAGRGERVRTELSSLVRRLAAPRERRTGAFAAVTLPPAGGETVTPVGASRPPPIPSHVWAPPVPKAPVGPALTTGRTHNTLAGLGPDDAVLTPIELIELPGLPTEKAMTTVDADEVGAVADSAHAAPRDAATTAIVAAGDAPTITHEVSAATNGTNGASNGSHAVEASDASWTPPVVRESPPSPEPVFAEPRREEHAPVEPPSSPVPGVSLPPQPSSNRATAAVMMLLLLSGGIAIYFGLEGGDIGKQTTYSPSTAPLTVEVASPAKTSAATPTEPANAAAAPTAAAPAPAQPTQAQPTAQAQPRTPSAQAQPLAQAQPTTPSAQAQPTTPSAQPQPTTPSAQAQPTVKAEPGEPSQQSTTSPSQEPARHAVATLPASEVVKSAGDKVEIATTPTGAQVYVDGQLVGASPVSVAAGKHHIVVAAERFALMKRDEELKPGEPLRLTLAAATLPESVAGGAGLKVRCKTLGELRIFVDGADSGVNCPNDARISVKPGAHKIGLYSPRTDETRELEHDIVDGNNSTRVYTRY